MRYMLAVLALVLGGCTMVDETEHCVETRYGRVVTEKMSQGLNGTLVTQATCFSLTEQNYPENGEAESMEAQTSDPVTVIGDVSLVFAYDPATVYDVFLEKRSEEQARIEILNGVREGYRNALAGWSVAEIFSERRASLADSVKSHIQRKVGDRAKILQVFVRDIKIPPAIEEARVAAAQQAQILDRAQKQFVIDSVNASAQLMKANAAAQAKELEARAYEANPRLLDLEIAKAMAGLCNGTQTCVVGGSVADTWRLR